MLDISAPLFACHILIVPSSEPERIFSPSWENIQHRTKLEWPNRVITQGSGYCDLLRCWSQWLATAIGLRCCHNLDADSATDELSGWFAAYLVVRVTLIFNSDDGRLSGETTSCWKVNSNWLIYRRGTCWNAMVGWDERVWASLIKYLRKSSTTFTLPNE